MLIVTLRNISELRDVSDYTWSVHVNQKEIASGVLRGHTRADGWVALLAELVAQQIPKENNNARK